MKHTYHYLAGGDFLFSWATIGFTATVAITVAMGLLSEILLAL